MEVMVKGSEVKQGKRTRGGGDLPHMLNAGGRENPP